MRVVLLVAALLAVPALAWGPIGTDDAGCLIYDYNTVVDAGLTALPDGGFIGPGGVCIFLTEVTTDYVGKRVFEKFDASTVPDPPGSYTPVGIPSQDGGVHPLNPFNPDAGLPNPLGVCADGQGWSFETGTWQGWTPTGALNNSRMGPVYGNNVHIERLHPPGYVLANNGNDGGMNATVGGDYWMYSRDVNQQGDYWVGSRDRRKDWTVWPGETITESSTASLYSPTFVIGTSYLDFYLGGGSHVSQRVELQIQPQGGWSQAALLAQYDGIGVSEYPQDYVSMVKTDGTWVVVRASSPMVQSNGENDFMGRHVAWNVSQFMFLNARIRVLDNPRSYSGTVQPLSHLNADHFRCTNSLDPKNVWLTKTGGSIAKVGQAVLPQPLWGVTDLHTHAAANISFGGHLIWGDVSDPLTNVYNCDKGVPAITLVNGTVVRPAIAEPDVHTECYVNVGIVVLANVAANAACVAISAGVAAIPFIGPALAAPAIAACTIAVAAATAELLSSPVLQSDSLHGGLAPTSGGLGLGDWLDSLAALITDGKKLHIQGVIELLDFDLPDGRHSGHFGKLHQQYQYQMITRAWQGGLRLIVLDSVNGRAISALLDGVPDKKTYQDWASIHDTIVAARRLTACAGDPVFKPGPLCNIAEIAKTPMHARRIIAGNKLAIILGTEVDELGKLRDASMMSLWGHPGGTDSLTLQIKDLYDWGIRKVTAIHGIDNPLGGTGIFNDIYATSQQYHNLTRTQPVGGTDGTWVAWKPGADFALPATFIDPLAGLVLGTFTPGSKLVAKPGVTNNGLVKVETSTPTETQIGGYSDITFRYGMASIKHPLGRLKGNFQINGVPVINPGWIPMAAYATDTSSDAEERTGFKTLLRLNNLGWIIGANPLGLGSTSRCSLENASVPLDYDTPELQAASNNYVQALDGHFNARGLTSDGTSFMHQMMEKGLTFDLDHFSQRSRLDGYALAHSFATEAGSGVDYATFGVHTSFRGLEKSMPVTAETRDQQGFSAETDRTAAELTMLRAQGGMVSPAATAALVPNAAFGSTNNNCDFSSKSWSQKYLAFMVQLHGHGIGVSTDMNGLATPMTSRFGMAACHLDHYAEDEWQDDEKDVQSWPRDFVSTVPAICFANTRKPGPSWDGSCPSTQMLAQQHQEASAVIYDDYASKVVGTLQASPLIQRVMARAANQVRDDSGPRLAHDEQVTIGGSHQVYPIKKFRNSASPNNTGWDFNLDGLKHIGLYPDFFQDVRNGGLTFEQLTPLFNSSEEYVRMWEQNCSMAVSWASAHGTSGPACTGVGEPWPAL